jgi:hypothetical protein
MNLTNNNLIVICTLLYTICWILLVIYYIYFRWYHLLLVDLSAGKRQWNTKYTITCFSSRVIFKSKSFVGSTLKFTCVPEIHAFTNPFFWRVPGRCLFRDPENMLLNDRVKRQGTKGSTMFDPLALAHIFGISSIWRFFVDSNAFKCWLQVAFT